MTTRLPFGIRASALSAAVLLAAGCTTGYLDSKNQDIIDPANLNSIAGLPALINGARGDFAYANAGDQGNQEGQIITSGMVADELINSETFPTRIEMDRRVMRTENSSLEGSFRGIQRARVAASQAAATVRSINPTGTDSPAQIAEMQSLAGIAITIMGENYCGNVPLGDFTPDSIVYGPGLTTTQLFQAAIAQFDSALAVNPGYEFASVGKGRALLNLGQYDAAAAAVATVASDYAYIEEHADLPSRIVNGVYAFEKEFERFSVADNEGLNGLDFVSANDPRVPSLATGGPGFDATTPQINQLKYPKRSSSINVADGTEARLIEAEALLNAGGALGAGNTAGFLQKLNDLRAAAGLPDLLLPPTPKGRVDLLFRERAFWMFHTGHRLGDLRRLLRQYASLGYTPNTVFPTGAYFKLGVDYGDQVAIPVNNREDNNPQYDRTKCDPLVP